MTERAETYRRVLAAAAVRAEHALLQQAQCNGIPDARLRFDLQDFEAALADGQTDFDGRLFERAGDYLTADEFYAACNVAQEVTH